MPTVVRIIDVHDGFNEVEFPRLDLNIDGSVIQNIRLRCGTAIVQPLKQGGVTASGIELARQDGIPTIYALVLAVSPYHVPEGGDPHINDGLPVPGDIIVKAPYAAEPLDAPALGTGVALEGLAPMERSTRGIGIMNLRDVQAILGEEETV